MKQFFFKIWIWKQPTHSCLSCCLNLTPWTVHKNTVWLLCIMLVQPAQCFFFFFQFWFILLEPFIGLNTVRTIFWSTSGPSCEPAWTQATPRVVSEVLMCAVSYFDIHFLFVSALLVTSNIQCGWRSFTAILSTAGCVLMGLNYLFQSRQLLQRVRYSVVRCRRRVHAC